MTEIYMSRLYAFIQTVFLPVIALGYWFCCYLVLPINTPGISVVFSYFIDGVMLFGAASYAGCHHYQRSAACVRFKLEALPHLRLEGCCKDRGLQFQGVAVVRSLRTRR